MKFEFNSNTVMAVIMFITLLGGGYTYIENQIKAVGENVDMLSNYDDTRILERLNTIEAKDITSEFAVLKQQISDLPVQKDYSEAINNINVTLAKIQTRLDGIDEHDHNGTYVRHENK